MDYHNIEWFALEMARDYSVIFEIASKYCISDSFVDHDGCSISSEGFLPTVVDIPVTQVSLNFLLLPSNSPFLVFSSVQFSHSVVSDSL